jgi:hypothetical protein
VGSAAVSNAVAQIETMMGASFQPAATVAPRGYNRQQPPTGFRTPGFASPHFQQGKQLVIDKMKTIRAAQEGVLRIAESLVDHRPDAARLVAVSKGCSASVCTDMQQQMETAFAGLGSINCRTNHGSLLSLCQHCATVSAPVFKASAAACYASHGHADSQAIDEALKKLIDRNSPSKLIKLPVVQELRKLRCDCNL